MLEIVLIWPCLIRVPNLVRIVRSIQMLLFIPPVVCIIAVHLSSGRDQVSCRTIHLQRIHVPSHRQVSTSTEKFCLMEFYPVRIQPNGHSQKPANSFSLSGRVCFCGVLLCEFKSALNVFKWRAIGAFI